MPDLAHLSLLDLVVLVTVVAAVVGALRRGAGLLGAVGSALGTALVAWLVLAALVAWGPGPWGHAARDTALIRAVPAPERAWDQAERLLGARP
ncbi:hypothetical protein [Nocardioides nanhaiensis]|uniref:CvpA family protein n=1 Tax=Nocardioides nanhaiensis TaxID=1476871 RepID=A0ABP8W4Q6_9ACTN